MVQMALCFYSARGLPSNWLIIGLAKTRRWFGFVNSYRVTAHRLRCRWAILNFCKFLCCTEFGLAG